MCVKGVGGLLPPPPTPLAGYVTSYAKTTEHCSPGSSMLLTINKFVESDAPTPVRIQGIKQLIGPLPVDKDYLDYLTDEDKKRLNVVVHHCF